MPPVSQTINTSDVEISSLFESNKENQAFENCNQMKNLYKEGGAGNGGFNMQREDGEIKKEVKVLKRENLRLTQEVRSLQNYVERYGMCFGVLGEAGKLSLRGFCWWVVLRLG